MDSADVRKQLKTGSESALTYHDDAVQMECSVHSAEAHIGHLHVIDDKRGQGLASTVFDALFQELRERDVSTVTAGVLATEFDAEDETTNPDIWQDPTVMFLDDYGFTGFEIIEYGEDKLLVRAHQSL